MNKLISDLQKNLSNFTKENLTDIFNVLQVELVKNDLLTESKISLGEEYKKQKIKQFKHTDNLQLVYSRLVMPEDLNPAHTLFGGRLLQWIDEVGVIFVYDKFKEKKIVTTEIQNVYFLCSPKVGDIVKFYVEALEERKASVWLRVTAINTTAENSPVVIDCHIRFAFIDRLKK